MPGHPLRDPDIRRLRALRMIEMKIKGASMAQIAQEFNVSDDTVARTLSWAKKAELVVQMEDKILTELLPAAAEAVKAVLQGVDDEVKAKTAIRIFESALPGFSKAKTAAGGTVAGTESDLGSYIAGLRKSAAAFDNVVDGEINPRALPGGPEGSTQRALPPAEASAAPQGVSVSSERVESPVESEGSSVDGE